jgi:hypothetical protein
MVSIRILRIHFLYLNNITIETVLFTDKIKKINMFDWVQERRFIITTEKIYNMKKNKVKRFITLNSMGGLSKAIGSTKGEFTIHVNKEYDYRYCSDR